MSAGPQTRASWPTVAALRPCGPLATWVDHYWFGVADDGVSATPRSLVLPDGRIDVVLEVVGARRSVAVYGSVTVPTTMTLAPGVRYIGIQFRAGCARHFLDVAAHELTDRSVGGGDVLKLSLADAGDIDDSHAIAAWLDAALLERLRQVPVAPSRIDRVVAEIERTHGSVRIDTLAACSGVSRRQIERNFLDVVGLTPKAFAAIRRFRYAGARLRTGASMAETALEAGYADQSHMCREFRRFAGLNPAAYARGDVAFLQDIKHLARDDEGLFFMERFAS